MFLFQIQVLGTLTLKTSTEWRCIFCSRNDDETATASFTSITLAWTTFHQSEDVELEYPSFSSTFCLILYNFLNKIIGF